MKFGLRFSHSLPLFTPFHCIYWKQPYTLSRFSQTMASVTASESLQASVGESVPTSLPVSGGSGGIMGIQPGEKTISEGSTTIVYGVSNECFYNKVQVLNRDMSIIAIKAFDKLRRESMTAKELRKEHIRRLKAAGKEVPDVFPDDLQPFGLRILEALGATGLRSIRYCKEIKGLERVLCNDIDPAAVESIRRNAALNGVDPTVLTPCQGDANITMYLNKGDPYHVVDLDPYGTASPFLDAAVQSVAEGGLMCITCTDLTALCGNHMEACYPKYGANPLKSRFCHEMALRIVLACVDKHANVHGRFIEPLLCVQMDFYVRVFVRVFDSTASSLYRAATRLSYVYQCVTCESFYLQPVSEVAVSNNGKSSKSVPAHGPTVPQSCTQCGSRFRMGGPMWHDPLHNHDFIDSMITLAQGDELSAHPSVLPESDAGSNTVETVARSRVRLVEILRACRNELPDAPLYIAPSSLASVLRCQNIPNKELHSALINAGYKVSQSHIKAEFLKTTAPPDVIWDVFRTWERTHPVAEQYRSNPNHAAYKILTRPASLEADFTINEAALTLPKSKFIHNPEDNWGPKARAVGKRPRKEDADDVDAAAGAEDAMPAKK